MKMYILISDSISVGMATIAAAHASLACYLELKNEPEVTDWLKHSFKKVTCIASVQEMRDCMDRSDRYITITEPSLGSMITAIAFMPRKGFPKYFRHLKLYDGGLSRKGI